MAVSHMRRWYGGHKNVCDLQQHDTKLDVRMVYKRMLDTFDKTIYQRAVSGHCDMKPLTFTETYSLTLGCPKWW